MNSISVMLIDDNPIFLRAAVQFLEAQDGIVVVGTAEGGKEALTRVRDLEPQTILVDLAMPGLPGLEAIPRLRDMLPQANVIALTVLDTKGFRKAALDAGADAFISKSTMRTDLVPAIRKLVQGGEGSAAEGAAIGPTLTPSSSETDARQRILVMEDDRHLRSVFTRALRAADYEVHPAGTVQRAVDLLKETRFDVLLCDIHMGGARGTDLVRDYDDVLFTSGAQIVMVSGHPEYRDMCQTMGVDFFLEKPVAISTLVTLMDRLTGRHGYPGNA